jgi:hypothetical protein
MNGEASIKTFLWAVVVGMGFRLGWGLVALLFDFLAKSMGK